MHARLTHLWREYQVNTDLTYTETITVDASVVDKQGIADEERSALTFYPKSQSLEVVEAWVDEPDGTRLPVPDSGRFTRPSEAAQNAPGFTSAMTTTLLYPQVREGSRTHVVWRLVQKTPALLGFNVEMVAPLDLPLDDGEVRIVAPAGVPMHWRVRGGFAVTEQDTDGLHAIEARIANTKAEEYERSMVDTRDFQPLFVATSLPDLRTIGAIYFRQSHDKAVATPAISELAHRVAGDRTGLAAARAVYDWVAGNIRYVAVYLDPNDGWVPHPAAEVLRNGYGDCKDHVVLMQAMLAALGIRAEAALIDQGSRTRDLPLWLPQFNHVVAYLPDFDVYANPTNPYARFASLDRMLADKTVVLATADGQVAHTRAQRPEDNQYPADQPHRDRHRRHARRAGDDRALGQPGERRARRDHRPVLAARRRRTAAGEFRRGRLRQFFHLRPARPDRAVRDARQLGKPARRHLRRARGVPDRAAGARPRCALAAARAAVQRRPAPASAADGGRRFVMDGHDRAAARHGGDPAAARRAFRELGRQLRGELRAHRAGSAGGAAHGGGAQPVQRGRIPRPAGADLRGAGGYPRGAGDRARGSVADRRAVAGAAADGR